MKVITLSYALKYRYPFGRTTFERARTPGCTRTLLENYGNGRSDRKPWISVSGRRCAREYLQRIVADIAEIRRVFNPVPTQVNAEANTLKANGVSTFSDWTAFGSVAPTSAPAKVSGQVVDSNGRAVYGANVTIVNSKGEARNAVTSPFGNSVFEGVRLDRGTQLTLGIGVYP